MQNPQLFLRFVILIVCLGTFNPSFAQDHSESEQSSLIQLQTVAGINSTALHLDTQVSMEISGMVATVTYVQKFKNDSTDWVEGNYLFPLPDTAAVNAIEMRLGDRVIRGEIRERQEARQLYEQAKVNGQRASLVEQQRPNMFSQKVANIAPNETIEVSITYLQRVLYQDSQFSLRLPLTITPRYIPGTLLPTNQEINLGDNGWGWARPTDQVSDADFITPFMTTARETSARSITNPVSINITLDAGLPLAEVDSPYHQISVSHLQQRYQISLAQAHTEMDRDFVLTWTPVFNQAPTAALFTEKVNDETYLMLMLLPPQQNQQEQTLARDVTFIIDTSGSMDGTSIIQAKAGLQLALQTLNSRDRFNIIDFNSVFSKFSHQSLSATNQNIQRAQAYVSRLQSGGGTEMFAPLDAALSELHAENYLKQIIFITDGSVGNEDALFSLIHNKLGSARLFTVGIGSAPNSFFMTRAAEFGLGTFTYIGHSNEIEEKMASLFTRLESPLLRDIETFWPDELEVEMWPRRIPDLYHGQPLVLTAKVSKLDGEFTVQGESNGSSWQQQLTLNSQQDNSGIGSLWARDKIKFLLSERSSGVSEDIIRPQVLELGLQHQLLSPYTSFIAIEEKIARPQEDSLHNEAIPNLVAQGQSPMPHTYPQGALGLYWHLLLSAVAFLLAALFYTFRLKYTHESS